MSIKTVGFCGLGTVGTWIAKEVHMAGYKVNFYDPHKLQVDFDFSAEQCSDLRSLVTQSDLIIESIPEDPAVKMMFYKEVDLLLNDKKIITSNTSFLLPSDFLPENFRHRSQFSCLHFYLPKTAIDIMPIEQTDHKVVEQLKSFAVSIGEEPILIEKPTRGYLVGVMASAAADAALVLLADEVASPEMIDKSWKKVTGMAKGPLQILDEVGLDTSLKIRKIKLTSKPNDPTLLKIIEVLEEYVSKGMLGKKSNKGFFEYPR